MSKIATLIIACALCVLPQGCSSGPGVVTPTEGFSGGVPITAKALTSVTPDPKPVEISVTWPSAPSSATAIFRYYVMDYSSPAAPVWVPQADALLALTGDPDGNWAAEVTANALTTAHTVLIKPGISKTYRVVVLVSMTSGGAEYVGACWFEAKP